jgi:hypothetical protein
MTMVGKNGNGNVSRETLRKWKKLKILISITFISQMFW